MRTLLILSKLRTFPAAVEAAADFAKYKIIVKEDLRAAESLLWPNLVDGAECPPSDGRGSRQRKRHAGQK